MGFEIGQITFTLDELEELADSYCSRCMGDCAECYLREFIKQAPYIDFVDERTITCSD